MRLDQLVPCKYWIIDNVDGLSCSAYYTMVNIILPSCLRSQKYFIEKVFNSLKHEMSRRGNTTLSHSTFTFVFMFPGSAARCIHYDTIELVYPYIIFCNSSALSPPVQFSSCDTVPHPIIRVG